MDTRQLLNAKKELENNILIAIDKEIDSFHKQTGLTIDEINISFAQFRTYDNILGSVWPEKVICKILME